MPGHRDRRLRAGVLRLRSSVLGKILGALVVVLVVSTAVTALVDARLTHDVVAEQTSDVAYSNLQVLQEAFGERQRNLVVNLQVLADRLATDGLLEPTRRPDLIARLGAEASNLGLDQLDVLDRDGRALVPPVSVGRLTPALGNGAPLPSERTSRLVGTEQGPVVQAVPVALGSTTRPLWLLGGLRFADDLAFQLRRQLGGLANVILVAGSRVVGSTLDTSASGDLPPAFDPADQGRPPGEPTLARVAGVDSVVAYVQVGRSAEDPLGGALGIVLADPTADFDRALGVRRLMAGTVLAVLAVALGWVLFRALTQRLVTLAGTAERIAGGDLQSSFTAAGTDEIARLAGALEHMRLELQAKLAEVARQAAELQESSQRIVTAQDEERRRLARDLHDGIQQQLLVLRLRLGLASDGPAALEGMEAELDRTIEQLRDVSHGLYPPILRDRGLVAALHSYAGKLPLASHIDVSPDPLPRLAPEVESGAYFLLCEAVTNALKHAEASELVMTLALDDGHLVVRVADDGKGFELAGTERHGGLISMEDRVRSFAGRLHITSEPGKGTTVEATFPVGTSVDGNGQGGAGEPAGLTPSDVGGRTAPPPPGGSYPAPR